MLFTYKGILSPSGFLTPSQSPSIQHSPRLQPSPSQSPFQQQDVLLVTNNNQHFINTFSTTQEQVSYYILTRYLFMELYDLLYDHVIIITRIVKLEHRVEDRP